MFGSEKKMKENHHSLYNVLFAVIVLILLFSNFTRADIIYVSSNGFPSGDGNIFKFDSDGNRTVFVSDLNISGRLAFDKLGSLYMLSGNIINKFNLNGQYSSFVSVFRNSVALAFDNSNNLYVSNAKTKLGDEGIIVKYDSSGNMSIFASDLDPRDITFDGSGNLYVANNEGGVGTIEKFGLNGDRYTFASGLNGPGHLAFDDNGNLYVSDSSERGSIIKFDLSGNRTTFTSEIIAGGFAFDSKNNLYAICPGDNWTHNKIMKFDSNGNMSTFASDVQLGWAYDIAIIPEPVTLSFLVFGSLTLLGQKRK